jgi:hypothetical protein
MTQNEYLEHENALKGGKPPAKPQVKSQNNTKRQSQNTKIPKKQSIRSTYVEPDVQDCQPTLSKIKVEDVVTEDQDSNIRTN